MDKSGHINISEFKSAVANFYEACIGYISQWNTAFEEIEVLEWVLLREVPSQSKVEVSINFILEKRVGLQLDDTELFDEFSCIKSYVTANKIKEWAYNSKTSEQKWVEIFTHLHGKNISYVNILKIVEFAMS